MVKLLTFERMHGNNYLIWNEWVNVQNSKLNALIEVSVKWQNYGGTRLLVLSLGLGCLRIGWIE